MNRINKVVISIGIVIVLALLIHRFVIQKETYYTAEATVQLLRNDPTEIQYLEETDESSSAHSILFINECSDPLGILIEEKKQLFQPNDSKYLMLPSDQEITTLTIARKTGTEINVVLKTRIFLSQNRSETMTASEGPDGKIRLKTVRNEKPQPVR
tara:strand:+ start:579 stop:1046 length:468 start_codon:yes stop_codon:yes gene_type:complete